MPYRWGGQLPTAQNLSLVSCCPQAASRLLPTALRCGFALAASVCVLLRMADAAAVPRPRLLCLHGKASTGSAFLKRLEPLTGLADLYCPDAPHPQGSGYSWWLLPEGERSFTTKTFIHWDRTVAEVQRIWSEQGPFDGLLGFSQGAILIAALAAVGALRPDPEGGLRPPPRVLVLVGGAVPGPFRDELQSMVALATAGALPGGTEAAVAAGASSYSALHVIGKIDDVNPPEGGNEVAAAMGGAIYEHEGSHDIPLDEAALDVYGRFLAAARSGAGPSAEVEGGLQAG